MDDEPEVENIVPESALALLQAIYRSSMVPLHTRMRAASIALPFEVPKLAVMGYNQMTDASFAVALEKAIRRSAEQKVTLELSVNHDAEER